MEHELIYNAADYLSIFEPRMANRILDKICDSVNLE